MSLLLLLLATATVAFGVVAAVVDRSNDVVCGSVAGGAAAFDGAVTLLFLLLTGTVLHSLFLFVCYDCVFVLCPQCNCTSDD